MMTSAYDESYLNDAQNNLGDMMDYAVLDCSYDADDFFKLFLVCGIGEQFAKGNPKFIAGMSGPELAKEVVHRISGRQLDVRPSENSDKSPEYWAGWALAYYQWQAGCSFAAIHKVLPFSELLRLYPTMHEAYVQRFAWIADQRTAQYKAGNETSLARIRKAKGYSQKRLAEVSGVTLRMIQLYEQKQNDIAKAQASTLLSLSRALGCRLEDLME